MKPPPPPPKPNESIEGYADRLKEWRKLGSPDTVQTIEKYGKQGLVVSVCYGECGDYGYQYSVTVMDPSTGKEFDKPFGASSFGDIAMILDIEVPAMLAR